MIKKALIFISAAALLSASEIFASYEALALQESKLAFGTVGVISQMKVSLGDKVKKGQVLATLESSVERARINAAKAQLALANSQLSRAQKASTALSKSAMDEALAAKQVATASLELALASMELKTLRAPYAGTVAFKMAQNGDGIASPAQPVLLLQDNSAIKLAISFDIDALNSVKVGDEFEFELNGKIRRAKITAIAPNASQIDRKVQARAIYHGDELHPGAYGEGKIITK